MKDRDQMFGPKEKWECYIRTPVQSLRCRFPRYHSRSQRSGNCSLADRTGKKRRRGRSLNSQGQELIFCGHGEERQSSYQTRVIAAWAITAVCPIGKGTLFAALLVALLKKKKTQGTSFSRLNKADDDKRMWPAEVKRNSPLSLRSHTPLPFPWIHSHILLSQTAAPNKTGEVEPYRSITKSAIHGSGDMWGKKGAEEEAANLGWSVKQTRASTFEEKLLVITDAAFGESPWVLDTEEKREARW